MEIRFNVLGAERKAFVSTVSDLVGWGPVYKKAPTFAYVVNDLTIDKDGTLIFPEGMDRNEAERLLEALAARGYISGDSLPAVPTEAAPQEDEMSDTTAPADGVPDERDSANETNAPGTPGSLSIELPLEGFTEQALANLEKLAASKAGLIRASIGADSLPIRRDGERLCFPWFAPDSSPEEIRAYTQFVGALYEMAKNQRRITATERAVENPKYAMRCFLLRLGFIGDKYAAARKLLLRNLPGNGSFKSGARKERPAGNAANPAVSAPPAECADSAGDAPEPPETALTGGVSGLAETLADAVLIHKVNASFCDSDEV